jgi:hypothetical protein
MKSTLSINRDGTKYWKTLNGSLHMEDGPAIEWNGGTKEWWVNGIRHREDGLAVEWSDGNKRWWIDGISYTKKEYKYEMRSRKLKLLL